jgi:protein-tyrosine-phosphatase
MKLHSILFVCMGNICHSLSAHAVFLHRVRTPGASSSRRPAVWAGVLAGLLVIGLPLPGFAWGTQGHQVIASLAYAQLTPAARKEVDRLLALEPGETLGSISTWADEHRNPSTGARHYVNFPRDSCTFDAQRDCPDGHCVVGAIEREMAVLVSNASDESRLKALKYVVHLVGDVHQPLHAGYLDDKGGNTVQLQAFMRGTNLHALWDSGLIRSLEQDTDTMVQRLLLRSLPVATRNGSAAQAAEESCRIVGTPGFYPARKVGMDYIEHFKPTMEQRLAQAGVRLAGMLNRVFR